MNEKSPRWLAPVPLAVLLVCLAAAVATVVLAVVTVDTRASVPDGWWFAAVASAAMLTWAVVGALVASRHPRNPLGWLFLTAGVVFTVGALLDAYAMATTTDGARLAGREYAGWGSHTLLQNPAVFGLFAIVLLLFPSGSASGPRWRRLTQVLTAAAGSYTVLVALRPGDLAEVIPPTPNPFGLAALEAVWPFIDLPLALTFLTGCIAGVVSVIVRFRRATGVERQQLKWLLAGAGGLVTVVLSGPIVFWPRESLWDVWTVVFVGALTLLPLTAGFAMLRYRLFEIDRIVSRTASYLVVIGVLIGAYVASTLVLSAALRPVTGSGDLPVALSTLVVAAAFRPVQRRVRGVVERRFNRRRYDAQLALAGFGQSLRSELDGNQIAGSVRQLVGATFEPHHVELWLPTGPRTF